MHAVRDRLVHTRVPSGPLVPQCRAIAWPEAERVGPIARAAQIYEFMSGRARGLKNEQAWVLLCDRRRYLCVESVIARGGARHVDIDLDWALACARSDQMPYAVLAHNHPSGDAWPSVADGRLTIDMLATSQRQGVTLLDHVIVGDGQYYSFAEQRIGSTMASLGN